MASQGYARPDLLVETDWLERRLDEPNLRIVDCDQYDRYLRAHIRNAVGIPVHHYIKHPLFEEDPDHYPLVMPPGPFADLMANMGIGDDTLVVAYDSEGGLHAARFWWVLNYYGHDSVKVLNGGGNKWFDEGRPAAIEAPNPPKGTFTVRQKPDLVCTLDYGLDRVGRTDTVFLDVRTKEEWDGTNSRGNRRVGHVPGAIHLEWAEFVTPDQYQTFKPAHQLRAMLGERGITPEKEVITY